MLDINFLRQNKDLVKKATADKGCNPELIENVLSLDEERRNLIGKVEKLREERNKITENIKYQISKTCPKCFAYRSRRVKSTNQNSKLEELKNQVREIKKKMDNIEPRLEKVQKDFNELLLRIPNPALSDVKVGKDEKDNEVIRKWGKPRNFDFKVKDHLELGEELGLIDIKRAGKVSGSRFGYLKGDTVLLQYALIQLVFDELLKKGFTPITPPVLINRKSMQGMGYLEYGESEMFVLEKDNFVLVGTSEQAIGPMHANEVFNIKDLPKRYLSISTCFRREAGSYGKDTRGIFRVHQFDKVEMFSFTTPEKSDKEHEYLLSLEEKFFQMLEIPYQVVKMCTGDLGAPAARKYDLEAWMPGQGKYREVTSTSTTTDFQSRRLNIKYRDGVKTDYIHLLNGTAFAIGRTIIAILENYQQKDGSIEVPRILQKYLQKNIIHVRTRPESKKV